MLSDYATKQCMLAGCAYQHEQLHVDFDTLTGLEA